VPYAFLAALAKRLCRLLILRFRAGRRLES
jgi:hypothetical protein